MITLIWLVATHGCEIQTLVENNEEIHLVLLR